MGDRTTAAGLRRGHARARRPGDEDWLDWIAAHADRLDPPERVPREPSLPESPTEWSELAPYLKRWPAAPATVVEPALGVSHVLTL